LIASSGYLDWHTYFPFTSGFPIREVKKHVPIKHSLEKQRQLESQDKAQSNLQLYSCQIVLPKMSLHDLELEIFVSHPLPALPHENVTVQYSILILHFKYSGVQNTAIKVRTISYGFATSIFPLWFLFCRRKLLMLYLDHKVSYSLHPIYSWEQ